MAFGCKDPSVTYLNRYGYNVVKLPRAGINPLQVLGRDKGLHLIGDLAAVWKTPAPPPQPGPPRRAVNVEGQKTDQLDLSIGLTMLANALAAFGATTPSLEFAYHKADKVQFTLTNVSAVGIDPFEVGEFLATGDLNLKNPVAAEYFDRDDSSAYIITEVLISDSITVAATDSRNVAVTVDVPAISNVIGTKVGVKPASDGSSSLTYLWAHTGHLRIQGVRDRVRGRPVEDPGRGGERQCRLRTGPASETSRGHLQSGRRDQGVGSRHECVFVKESLCRSERSRAAAAPTR